MPKEAITPNHPTPFSPLTLTPAEGEAIPLIADSPHSGVKYPADFRFALPFDLLRTGEDTDVDVLWQAIPKVGGTLLAAEFPRSYIDPNRNADDIDIAMLSRYWPYKAKPSEKSRLGAGLIWNLAHYRDETHAVYDRLLEPEEVLNRINTYYRPYHQALQQQTNDMHAQFGAYWHLNLHSMPGDAYEALGLGQGTLADFVLGNRDGTTCSDEFIHLVADSLKNKGYSVALNDPYKGVALIANTGNPTQNKHSLQIEIHRKLYMHEASRERNEHFTQLQTDLSDVSVDIANYIRSKI